MPITLRKVMQDFHGCPMVKNPLANAGDMGSIPGIGRSHMQQGNYACTPQLLSSCSRACASQRLSLPALEPVLCNKRSRCNEKPEHCNKSSPCPPQLEKACAQQ